MAIEYSRCLYNLEDVSSFPLDEDEDEGEGEDESVEDVMSKLSDEHYSKLCDFVESKCEESGGSIEVTPQSVGMMAVDFWSIEQFRMRPSSSASFSSSSLCLDVDLSSHLDTKNLQALRDMLEILTDDKSSEDFSARDERKVTTSSTDWDRFLAGHAYQLSCKCIWSTLRSKLLSSAPEERRRRLQAYKVYNAKVFSSCLEKINVEDSKYVLRESRHAANQYMSSASSFISFHGASQSEVAVEVRVSEKRASQPVSSSSSSSSSSPVLPIDQYKEQILETIMRDRVTIIHGETGCGKSSRLPVMLLQSAEERGVRCKMMVSQPRRIAATSLYNRVKSSMGDKVGLRMGHGIKEEGNKTKIYFVTTGYLVRLLAHRPSVFDEHSHLIIDEVHERSVDGDVLCLLTKRLLLRNKNIHIVLMSATIHTEIYRQYFQEEGNIYGDLKCLSVGLRRFPINILYLEHLNNLARGAYKSLLSFVLIVLKSLSFFCLTVYSHHHVM
jgi:HrpA-like RNA helicase